MTVADIQNAIINAQKTDNDVKRTHIIDRVRAWLMQTDIDGEVTDDGGDPILTVSTNQVIDAPVMKTAHPVPDDDDVYGEINETGLCVYTAAKDRIDDDSDTTNVRIMAVMSPFEIWDEPDLIIIDGVVYHTPYVDLVPGAITDEPEAGFVEDVIENGVEEPIITADVDGKVTVIDGHTRLSVVEVLRGEGVKVDFSTTHKGLWDNKSATKRAAVLNTQSRQIGPDDRRDLMKRLKDRMGWKKWTTKNRLQKDWAQMMGVTPATISHDFDKMGVRRGDDGEDDDTSTENTETVKTLVQRQAARKKDKRQTSMIKTGLTYFDESPSVADHLTEYSADEVRSIMDDVRSAVTAYHREIDAEIDAIDTLIDDGDIPDDDNDLELKISELKAQIKAVSDDTVAVDGFERGDLIFFCYNRDAGTYRIGYVISTPRSDSSTVPVRSLSTAGSSASWVDCRPDRSDVIVEVASDCDDIPGGDDDVTQWHLYLGIGIGLAIDDEPDPDKMASLVEDTINGYDDLDSFVDDTEREVDLEEAV